MRTTSASIAALIRVPFRRAKAAVKMHALLDPCGSIPSFIHVSDGKPHDVNPPTMLANDRELASRRLTSC